MAFYISKSVGDTQMKTKHIIDTDSKNVCNADKPQIIEDITEKVAPKKRAPKKKAE